MLSKVVGLKEINTALRSNIQCSFCSKTMTDPVSTLCNHQFCRKCILDFMKKTTQNACPRCDHRIAIEHLTADKFFPQLSNLVQILAKEIDAEINSSVASVNTTKRFDYVPREVVSPQIINNDVVRTHMEDTIDLTSTRKTEIRNSNTRLSIPPARGLRNPDSDTSLRGCNGRGTLLTQLDREDRLKSTPRLSATETRTGFNNKLYNYIVSEDLTGQNSVDGRHIGTATPDNGSVASSNEENEMLFIPAGETNMSVNSKVHTWLRNLKNDENSDEIIINENDSSLEEEPNSTSRPVQLQTAKRQCGFIAPHAENVATTVDAEDPYEFIPSQHAVPLTRSRGKPRGRATRQPVRNRAVRGGKAKIVPIEKAEVYENVQLDESSHSENEDDMYRLFITPSLTVDEINVQKGKRKTRPAAPSKRMPVKDRREYEKEIKALAEEIEDAEKHDLTIATSKRRKINIVNDCAGPSRISDATGMLKQNRCYFSPESSGNDIPSGAFAFLSVDDSPNELRNEDAPVVEKNISALECGRDCTLTSREEYNSEKIGAETRTINHTVDNVTVVNDYPSKMASHDEAQRENGFDGVHGFEQSRNIFHSLSLSLSTKKTLNQTNALKSVSEIGNTTTPTQINVPNRIKSRISSFDKINSLNSTPKKMDSSVSTPNKMNSRVNTPNKMTLVRTESSQSNSTTEQNEVLENTSFCRHCGIAAPSVVSLGVQTDFQFSPSTDVVMYPSFRVPVNGPKAKSSEDKINNDDTYRTSDLESDRLVIDEDRRGSAQSVTSGVASLVSGSAQTPPSKELDFENYQEIKEENIEMENDAIELESNLIENGSLSSLNDSITTQTQALDTEQFYGNRSFNRTKRKRSNEFENLDEDMNKSPEIDYQDENECCMDDDMFTSVGDKRNKFPSGQTSTPKSDSDNSVINRPNRKGNTSRRLEDSSDEEGPKNIFEAFSNKSLSCPKAPEPVGVANEQLLGRSEPTRGRQRAKTRRGLANISNLFDEFATRKEHLRAPTLKEFGVNERPFVQFGGGSPRGGTKSKTRRNLGEIVADQADSSSEDVILPTPDSKTRVGRSFTSVSELNEDEADRRQKTVDDSGYQSTKKNVLAKRCLGNLFDEEIGEGNEMEDESAFVNEENVQECSIRSHESAVERLRRKHQSFLECPEESNRAECEGKQTTQRTPIGNKGTPIGNKGTPIGNKGTPIGNKGTPIGNKGTPIGNKGTPIEMKGTQIEMKGTQIEKEVTQIEMRGTSTERRGAVDEVTDSELLNLDLDFCNDDGEEEEEEMTTNYSRRKTDYLTEKQIIGELSINKASSKPSTSVQVVPEASMSGVRHHSRLERMSSSSGLRDGIAAPRKEVNKNNSRLLENVIEQPVEEERRLSFVASGLTATEMKHIQDLANKINGDFRLKFSDDTSHVIVKTGRDFITNRTLKYLEGIASKRWIVSFDWVTDSLRTGRLQNEERYEAVGDRIQGNHSGPMRSRLSNDLLLKNYEICCYGDYLEISKDDVIRLASACGASSVFSATMFGYKSGMIQLLLLQSIRHVNKIQDVCNKYGVIAVVRDWLLDSISQYRILPMKTYPHLNPTV